MPLLTDERRSPRESLSLPCPSSSMVPQQSRDAAETESESESTAASSRVTRYSFDCPFCSIPPVLLPGRPLASHPTTGPAAINYRSSAGDLTQRVARKIAELKTAGLGDDRISSYF